MKKLTGEYHEDCNSLNKDITRLRGQLENCVNHLERVKRKIYDNGQVDECIESANKALYETL